MNTAETGTHDNPTLGVVVCVNSMSPIQNRWSPDDHVLFDRGELECSDRFSKGFSYHSSAAMFAAVDSRAASRGWFAAKLTLAQQRATRPRIADLSTFDEIVDVLRSTVSDSAARKVTALLKLHENDPDEPRPDMESLKRMAETIIHNRLCSPNRIALSGAGYLHAEWDTIHGEVSMAFRPRGRIEFAFLGSPEGDEPDDQHLDGSLSTSRTIDSIGWLIPRTSVL